MLYLPYVDLEKYHHPSFLIFPSSSLQRLYSYFAIQLFIE